VSDRAEPLKNSGKAQSIRFGSFLADLDSQELFKNKIRLKIPGQSFRVLALLLEKPGVLVTREELQQSLWPSDTFVDFDHGLSAAVNRLRDVLGESADAPVFVETLARRGYRFIAPVEKLGGSEPVTPMTSASDVGRHRPKSRWIGFAVIAMAAALGLLLLVRNSGWGASTRDNSINSLAVLPLENLSRDPDQQYFSDGMTDALIAQLSKATTLRVTSRTSTARFKDTKESLPEIARELSVEGVVEGTVTRSGNRVRITVQLIRARNDQHIWANSYERDLSDVLKLQSEVAEAVARQVRAQLSSASQAPSDSTSAVDPEAYEAYLKGTYNRSQGNLVTLRQAQGYFEEAIRRDPAFPLAYVGLAGSYLDLGTDRWLPPQEAYRKGSEAIHKALELDNSIGEAHTELGYLEWQYGWNWADAEKELHDGVELSPKDVNGRETLVWYLGWKGKRDEALAEIQRIAQLDPLNPYLLIDYAGVYYHQRDYKSLVEAAQKSLGPAPNTWSAHYFLAVGYQGMGRLPEAVEEYRRAVELSQQNSDAVAGLAHAYASMGRAAEARKILAEVQKQSSVVYVSPYMVAAIYSGLGDKDKAYLFLEKAYEERSPDLAYFSKADLRMDALRQDSRFQSILQRVALP
jgi:TolB-like protein/DNA-binding winged helix-turn-helix (wHTH) protein